MSDLDLLYWDREVEAKPHLAVRIFKTFGAVVIVIVAGLVGAVVIGTAIFFASLEAADKLGLL